MILYNMCTHDTYANREILSKLLLAWILSGKISKLPNHNKLHNTTQIKKQTHKCKEGKVD